MSKYNTNKNKYLAKSERASVPKITKKQKIYMKESTVKKVINRIKGDRWGKWDDLITEMDGHSTSGIL